MRAIDFIKKIMKYNELLVKIIKADAWFSDPNISQEKKEKFYPNYEKVMEEIAKISNDLDEIGITFKDKEAIEGIELPQELKRKDIEIFLEEWYKHLKEKEKLKVGT